MDNPMKSFISLTGESKFLIRRSIQDFVQNWPRAQNPIENPPEIVPGTIVRFLGCQWGTRLIHEWVPHDSDNYYFNNETAHLVLALIHNHNNELDGIQLLGRGNADPSPIKFIVRFTPLIPQKDIPRVLSRILIPVVNDTKVHYDRP